MVSVSRLDFYGKLVMTSFVAAAMAVWQYLIVSKEVQVGVWGLVVSGGLGVALGHLGFDVVLAKARLRREKQLDRYRGMSISIEPNDEGRLIAVAENENVFTTLELPEGYDPREDRGELMLQLFAREFGFLPK